MRAFCKLAGLFLGITLGACAAAESPPTCLAALTPTSTTPPKLPPRLHNEFYGKAQVSFVISPAGEVLSPVILSTEWHPVGRSSGQPIGYNEAILSSVAQWRYPSRQRACRHQVPVELQVAGTDPMAGRSNNSSKPTPLRGAA